MKALSIRQPWAWAIFHADKDVENRDWSTRLRGRIAIHAAKGCSEYEYADAVDVMQHIDPRIVVPPLSELPRGAIIGTVEIVDCVSRSGSPWFFGDYGFIMRNPIALPEPIECKGALGVWNVPEDIESALLLINYLTCYPKSSGTTDAS